MASLFRKTVTRYVDADGRRCRKEMPGARKIPKRSKVWYGCYRDHDGIERLEKLYASKTASAQALAERVRKAELRQAGVADPFEEHAKTPLRTHLDDFIASLQHAGCTSDHVGPVRSRCLRIVDGCKFRFISDVSASAVQSYLAELKQRGLGQRTLNHYLAAIKQFARWLVVDRRTGDNRLIHLKGGNATLDVRRERRELGEDEIRRLLATARNCQRKGFTLSGPQRHTL